jgi:hypothetical protein
VIHGIFFNVDSKIEKKEKWRQSNEIVKIESTTSFCIEIMREFTNIRQHEYLFTPVNVPFNPDELYPDAE